MGKNSQIGLALCLELSDASFAFRSGYAMGGLKPRTRRFCELYFTPYSILIFRSPFVIVKRRKITEQSQPADPTD